MNSDELSPSTTADLRLRVRDLIEAENATGRNPLRKVEKHRAYYALTGKKIEGASNGEVSYKLLGLLEDDYGLANVKRYDSRDPWDSSGPLSKTELEILVDALEKEADDG